MNVFALVTTVTEFVAWTFDFTQNNVGEELYSFTARRHSVLAVGEVSYVRFWGN